MLDRATGKNISSTEYVKTNWAKGVDAQGLPIPDPAKEPQTRRRAGDAESGRRDQLAAAELQSRDRPVLRQRARAFSVYYIYDPSDNPRAGAATIAAAGARP